MGWPYSYANSPPNIPKRRTRGCLRVHIWPVEHLSSTAPASRELCNRGATSPQRRSTFSDSLWHSAHHLPLFLPLQYPTWTADSGGNSSAPRRSSSPTGSSDGTSYGIRASKTWHSTELDYFLWLQEAH